MSVPRKGESFVTAHTARRGDIDLGGAGDGGGSPASHREGFVAALPVPLAVPVSHHAASALPMMGRGGKGWEGGVAGKVVLGCVG